MNALVDVYQSVECKACSALNQVVGATLVFERDKATWFVAATGAEFKPAENVADATRMAMALHLQVTPYATELVVKRQGVEFTWLHTQRIESYRKFTDSDYCEAVVHAAARLYK